MNLRTQKPLRDFTSFGDGNGCQPAIDPVPCCLPFPDILPCIQARELPGESIATAALITHLFAIESPAEWIDDAIRQTTFISRPSEERGNIVHSLFDHRPKQDLHPIGRQRAKIAIDDNAGFYLKLFRERKECMKCMLAAGYP